MVILFFLQTQTTSWKGSSEVFVYKNIETEENPPYQGWIILVFPRRGLKKLSYETYNNMSVFSKTG